MENDTDTLSLFYSQIESKANDLNGNFLFLSTFSIMILSGATFAYALQPHRHTQTHMYAHAHSHSLVRSLCVCECVYRILSNEYLHPHIHGICAFNRSRIKGQTMELNELN